MLVERFVEWSRSASVKDRGLAVSKICKSYRRAAVGDVERRSGIALMTVVLDDPSPKVRLALAEGLSQCPDVPRHLLIALARDVPAVAAPILLGSNGLGEDDLIDLVRSGEEACALAVASRSRMSPALARAVIECGGSDAILKVLDHCGLELAHEALDRIAVRFGDIPTIRSRLLTQLDPATPTARRLRASHAEALCAFVAERNWLSPARGARLRNEISEAATLAEVVGLQGEALDAMLRDATGEGRVTPSLLVRAVACGQLEVVERSIAVLAECTRERVATAFRSKRKSALAALLLRAGIGGDIGRMLATAHSTWVEQLGLCRSGGEAEEVNILRQVVRALGSQIGAVAPSVIVALLADLELEIERHAARTYREPLLLAA